jgi:small-conductance mechanosensitive channel
MPKNLSDGGIFSTAKYSLATAVAFIAIIGAVFGLRSLPVDVSAGIVGGIAGAILGFFI